MFKPQFLFVILSLMAFRPLSSQQVIRLYEGKAPGSEDWIWDEATDLDNAWNTEVVYNVSSPTLTAFLPEGVDKPTSAVIIAPGGGFQALSINSEGNDLAKWLNTQGVAAFVLKYRLVRSYTDDPVAELSRNSADRSQRDQAIAPIVRLAAADALVAVNYVRTHAEALQVHPDKIGLIGFSAGGTIAMSAVYNADDDNRPNLVAPIYAYEPAIWGDKVPEAKTPIFIVVASNDQLGLMPMSINLYQKWYAAGQPAELHIYEQGGHGFGMRIQNLPSDQWYLRFGEWLTLQGW